MRLLPSRSPRLIVVSLLAFGLLASLTSPVAAQEENPNTAAFLQDLAAARALWETQPAAISGNYGAEFTLCRTRGGGSDVICNYDRVAVSDGEVVHVAAVEPNGFDTFSATEWYWDRTVDDIFNALEGAAPGIYSGWEFDAQTGLPIKAAAYNTFSFELQISVSNVVVGPRGSVTESDIVVSCLAGNGRIDVNLINDGPTAATYVQRVGTLTPRSSVIQPNSWWRSPTTGRPDGPIQVEIIRNGVTIINEIVNVDCDSATPTVSGDGEVEILNWCTSGNGIIFAQFSNPYPTSRGYVLEVAPNDLYGNKFRRSTTAQAHGASVRGISGRPNGVYRATVFHDDLPIWVELVTVDC